MIMYICHPGYVIHVCHPSMEESRQEDGESWTGLPYIEDLSHKSLISSLTKLIKVK